MRAFLIVILWIGLCSLGSCEYNYYRTANQRTRYTTSNDLEWSDYAYSIDGGNCLGSKLVDENIKKDGDPDTYKKTTYNWSGRGMYRITCVRVLNRMPRDRNAAEARITEGGVGHDQVRIEMRSQNSQRTEFHVEIWGQETGSQGSNVAVMTRTPNGYLYMNGKKYCECN